MKRIISIATITIFAIAIISLVIFMITNPSLQQFKDSAPSDRDIFDALYETDCDPYSKKALPMKNISVEIKHRRSKNYILFSYYELEYFLKSSSSSDRCNMRVWKSSYLGVFNNFYYQPKNEYERTMNLNFHRPYNPLAPR